MTTRHVGRVCRGRYRLVLMGTVVLALLGSAGVAVGAEPAPASDRAPDGIWRSDGYGTVLTIDGGVLRPYETTDLGCVPGTPAYREHAPDGSVRFRARDAPDSYFPITVRRLPGRPERAALTVEGTLGRRELRRVRTLPADCLRPAPADPRAVFDVFWQTFRENYAFFAERGVDWAAARDRYRPMVRPDTTDDRLFEILTTMAEPLRDGHTSLRAPALDRFWRVGRPGTPELDQAYEDRIRAFVERRDLGGTPLRTFAAGAIGYAELPGRIGYLRINRFVGYTGDQAPFAVEAAELDRALDTIVTARRASGPDAWHGLIIDIRVNLGGLDDLGRRVAARLTDRAHPAYVKSARDDPRDPTRFTHPQAFRIEPAAGAPRYTGPVAVLTGPATVSAGETFALALRERPGPTTFVGDNTQGIFSDMFGRTLPNGWAFTLSNERYLSPTGRGFEGVGLPVDFRTPVFTDAEFAADRDSAFDRAVRLLGGRNP
ncbi:S41 family peptidase [Embleya sp. NPDC020630]|uniref:S41 family peptidase n=1 Tax=Embleya sp. NPDC020630 TaxID=3363979 RepID=UPI0037B6B89A